MIIFHLNIFRTVTVTHWLGVRLVAKKKRSTPQTSYLCLPNQQFSLNLQVSSGKSLITNFFYCINMVDTFMWPLSSYQEVLLIFNTYFRWYLVCCYVWLWIFNVLSPDILFCCDNELKPPTLTPRFNVTSSFNRIKQYIRW